MSVRELLWEISPARDPKNFDTFDSISAKLEYMLWCLQNKFLDKEQETVVKSKFVSQGAESVHKYVARFEEWKSRVWARELGVPESYFVSVFISGLREEIRVLVQVLEPQSVSHAWAIAALQETNLQSIHKKPKVGSIPSSTEKNSSISLQNCDLSGQKWKEKVAPENGLMNSSIDKSNISDSEENHATYDHLGPKLGEDLAPAKEFFVKGYSSETIDPHANEKLANQSKKIMGTEVVEVGRHGDQFKQEFEKMNGDQSGQNIENQMILENEIQDICFSFEEMGTNYLVSKMVAIGPRSQEKDEYSGSLGDKGLQVGFGKEMAFELSLSNDTINLDNIKFTEKVAKDLLLDQMVEHPQSSFRLQIKWTIKESKENLVWLRGPDPGGTRLGV